MKHKKLISLLCTGALLFSSAMPALANTANDTVGSATTIYQTYLTNGARGEIRLNTNVAGRSPAAENYMDEVLDLSTRLVPFSLDASMQYYSNVNPTTFFVTFRGRENNDLNASVQAKAKEIAKGAAIYGTDYEKIRYINNYIVDHCQYVAAAVKNPSQYPKAFTTYGCLIEGQAVCEGYANSVQLLCEMLNIPCIKVTGKAYGGNHIWNAVYLDGKWWILDVTFNDPVGRQDNKDRWSYFLLDIDTFQQKGTHTFDKSFYETSKEIYTGRTTGQRSTTLPYAGLSLQNAVKGDNIDDRYQVDETGTPVTSTTTPLAATTTPTESTATQSAQDKATEARAEALKAKNLFMGDERGFRLNDNMTRVEMGVMVMRMNDGQAALAADSAYYAGVCPFSDVPQWAVSSIGYLYDKKLVAGQSATRFGTGNVTKRDYAVMMLRVLGIDHTYDNAVTTAVAQGIMTQSMAAGDPTATRGDIVNMTYATLELLSRQNAA